MNIVSEEPLFVQLARAMGWSELQHTGSLLCNPPIEVWAGRHPKQLLTGEAGLEVVPRYDTDWAALGALIEFYGLSLTCNSFRRWQASRLTSSDRFPVWGEVWDKPGAAVASVLLNLHKLGKLEPLGLAPSS